MSLFVIGDLHLSYGADKPMDIFGGAWEGFAEKLDAAWRAAVAPEDTVVLCGDSSWGISLAEALPDFRYIDSLPGRKLLLKGNHDYYWDTVSKMRRFLAENGLLNDCKNKGTAEFFVTGETSYFEKNGSDTTVSTCKKLVELLLARDAESARKLMLTALNTALEGEMAVV